MIWYERPKHADITLCEVKTVSLHSVTHLLVRKQWTGSAYQPAVLRKQYLHEPQALKKSISTPQAENMFMVWDCSAEQITYGIIHAHNEVTFSFSSLWIKWFAETSVVCWGLYPHFLSISLFLFFYLFLPLHPRPTAFPEWPVFWVCFQRIYI